MSKKYIPDKAWLACDKGQQPTQITVTHDNNSKIYGERLVSEADMVPGENIKPFGICSITGGPCNYAPIYWDKCNQGVKVNGFKLVFEDANLLCNCGGKIAVTFNAPMGSQFDFGFTGLARSGQWLNYNGTIDYVQRGVIHDVENGKLPLTNPDGSASDFKRHGNYGEMKSNVYHRENGWRDVRNEHPNMNIDKPTASGIDGVYEKNGTYRVDDAKYNTAQIQNTNTQRETSRTWTDNHIDNDAINPNDQAAVRRANNNGTIERGVTRTHTDGSMQHEPLNEDGYRRGAGAKTDIDIKQSRTDKFMQSMRSSVRNSTPVKALANSNLSKSVQASAAATKANNAMWKATQYVESKPLLKTTGKVLGRGAVVVGIAIDAYSIYSAYEEEGEFGDKTQQATGSAVGGAAGAWAGAEIGAVIGTAICPGIGTAIGGVVGAIGGAIIGSGAGSKLVDWLF
jgi:hypothetical protein